MRKLKIIILFLFTLSINLYSQDVDNQLKCKSTNPIIVNLVNNMVKVDGGAFTMGATDEQGSDADDDEKPAHRVTLSGFYIGKYEVTQEEWKAVMGKNPSSFKGKSDSKKRPVEEVSWDDCQLFIKKLNDLTGLNFSLPTEAEWEYAARGGNKSRKTKYSGGASIDAVSWYRGNAYYKDESSPDYGTHPVGKKAPNELGLYDMTGNVREWCQDWYDENYYKNSPSSNPCNTASGSSRVVRGGSWGNNAWDCRVSHRNYNSPDSRYFGDLGLRLALVSPDNNYNSNNTTTSNSGNGSSTTPSSPPSGSFLSCPDNNHPHMIDLGLPSGTKWACCNVGANKPEGNGDYYAWGETQTKSVYNWSTYVHCDGSKETCHNIGSDIAGTQYDVAHVKWGGSWVMPSSDQNKELKDNCTYEWTTVNGVKGGKFTSKKNGASIFLPAAGNRWYDGLDYAGSRGYYWSSTQSPSYSYYAYNLYFNSGDTDWYYGYRRGNGHTVRPVSR